MSRWVQAWLGLWLLASPLGAEPGRGEEATPLPPIRIRGQIQVQMDSGGLGGARRDDSLPIRSGLGPYEAATRVFIRRARLLPTIPVARGWDLVNETDIDADEPDFNGYRISTQFMYLRGRLGPGALNVGQLKVPFGWEQVRSSRTTNTIERSDVSNSFFQADLGVTYVIDDGRRYLGLGVLQGQGPGRRDPNGSKDFAARALLPVLPGLRLGVSGYTGTHRPPGARQEIKSRRFGAELHYRSGPWLVEAEHIEGQGFNRFSQRDSRSRGHYGTLVLTLREDLDALLSYDFFDPDLDQVDRGFPNNRSNARTRWVIGLNGYITRDPVHRWMVNYEIHRTEEGPSLTTQGPRIRYQYAW